MSNATKGFDEWWRDTHGESPTTKREYDMCSCAYKAGHQLTTPVGSVDVPITDLRRLVHYAQSAIFTNACSGRLAYDFLGRMQDLLKEVASDE